MNVVEARVVEARFRIAEWLIASRPPGQRVRARLPFVHIEVERMWGHVPALPSTGRAFRAEGWVGPDEDRLSRVRLVVPWPGGCLWIMEARDGTST